MSDKYTCYIGGMITILYTVYISAHVLAHTLIPNGIILSGAVGALCVLAGVRYGDAKAKGLRATEGQE